MLDFLSCLHCGIGNFSYFVTVSSVGLFSTWNGSFTYAWFYTTVYYSSVKYQFSELCRFPNTENFIVQYQNFTLVNITTNLIRKFLVLASSQAYSDWYKFSKILIWIKRSDFIISNKHYQLFYTLFILKKMSAQYPSLNNPSLPVSHSFKYAWECTAITVHTWMNHTSVLAQAATAPQ